MKTLDTLNINKDIPSNNEKEVLSSLFSMALFFLTKILRQIKIITKGNYFFVLNIFSMIL